MMNTTNTTTYTPITTTSTPWMVIITVNGAKGNKAQPWELRTYATSADAAVVAASRGFRKPITVVSVTPMAD